MPCDTVARLTPAQIKAQENAQAVLARKLAAGQVSVVVSPQGAVAFRGWIAEERAGLTDLCAYRKLSASNSPELRRALARAEALAGRKVDQRLINAGVHSHDGGHTFNPGHGHEH